MTFTEFINVLPDQKDITISAFLTHAKKQADFPASSDPSVIAKALYKKLNHNMTAGFIKAVMIYSSMPNNEIPKALLNDEDKMLRAINHIVELQHSDKTYKDF
jgi:spore germination protein YaaH